MAVGQRLLKRGYLYIALAILIWCAYALSPNVGIYDWHKELAYFEYIKESLSTFQLAPFFWWDKLPELARYPAIVQTSNFLSNPETFLFSPFTPLLAITSAVSYIKLIVFLHFLIALAGVIALKRRLQWNDMQFRVYLILFLLSPVIIQHLAIGYTPWLNLFYFPWIVYFITLHKLFPKIMGLAAILAIILLQGGSHVFFWFFAFVTFYFVFQVIAQRQWIFALHWGLVAVGVGLLAFVRLYTTAQSYATLQQNLTNGYHLLNFLVWAFLPTLLLPPVYGFFTRFNWDGVPSWDGGMFWGLALIMGVVLVFRYRQVRVLSARNLAARELPLYRSLLAGAVLFGLLSFYSIYKSLLQLSTMVLPTPFLSGMEKYPFRFALLAFLLVSVAIAYDVDAIWQLFDAGFARISRWRIVPKVTRPSYSWLLVPARRHVVYEVLLVGPLLFSTSMWLLLAIAVPANDYPVQHVVSPEISVLPSDSQKPMSLVSPAQLILLPAPGFFQQAVYVLPSIKALDRRFLEVISGNAVLDELADHLAVRVIGPGPIIVRFRAEDYEGSMMITSVAWLGLIGSGCLWVALRRLKFV